MKSVIILDKQKEYLCMKVIEQRRSIRKYKSRPVSRDLIEKILQAGILAPSAKNRQPWHYTVATGRSKDEAVSLFRKGLERERMTPFLPKSTAYQSGAWQTVSIMAEAPVLIFVSNELAKPLQQTLDIDERESEICNIESIGASIENMILTATGLGLGTLWICDTCFAHPELSAWLGHELCAALAIGYADEQPEQRPRKSISECTDWRG